MLIVSAVVLTEGDPVAVEVMPAEGEKCPRCWNHRLLGADSAHPEVCERCAEVLGYYQGDYQGYSGANWNEACPEDS